MSNIDKLYSVILTKIKHWWNHRSEVFPEHRKYTYLIPEVYKKYTEERTNKQGTSQSY